MKKTKEIWYRWLAGYLRRSMQWFVPGLGVKRWIGVGLAVLI
jgi:hypothetical protein